MESVGLSHYLQDWSPSPAHADDELAAGPAAALAAVLDQPWPGGTTLPPLWHWLYFLDWPARRELGPDGHPLDGRFYPPIPDRRRMIAGGRVEIHRPLAFGVTTSRTSNLAKVEVKRGRTGELVFVTVRHEIAQNSTVGVVEEHDVVYRSGESARRKETVADPGESVTANAEWQLSARTDPPMLFRFSALTANAHRIHYDDPYVKDVEGYPGLVVHGPLLVLLMLELLSRNVPDSNVLSVSYRLYKPVFAGENMVALGDKETAASANLSIATARDQRHATAAVRLA